MSTKSEGVPCYDAAEVDEPLFVLRATDRLAPATVRQWAEWAHMVGTPKAKVDEALRCADAMEAWPNRKVPD